MSQKEKLIQKLKNNPNNVRFEVIQNLLLSLGFTENQPNTGSSHYTYVKGMNVITIPRHKPLNKIYVKKVIKLIENMEK